MNNKRLKNIRMLAFILLLTVLLALTFYFRVLEYFNLVSSSVRVENNVKGQEFSVRLLTPRKGNYTITKVGYFDTLILFDGGKLLSNEIPDVYGENRFIIGFGDQLEQSSCGIFKYRKWHKFKVKFSIHDKVDSYLVKWAIKSNFRTISGTDTFKK